MAPKRLPQFANEAEEAKWLFEHRAELASEMVVVSRAGRSGEGSLARARKRAQQESESVRKIATAKR